MENGACGRARVFYGRRGQRDGSGGAAGGGELAELGWLAQPEGAEDGGLSGGGGRAPADRAGCPAEGAQVHCAPGGGLRLLAAAGALLGVLLALVSTRFGADL